MHQLILASESPRRKTLLEEAGFSFHTFPVKVSEILDKNLTSRLTIQAQILKISETKAEAAWRQYKPLKPGRFLFLCADTMVVLKGTQLGKPKNTSEAFEFLRRLSGQMHEVMTAVTLLEAENMSQNEMRRLKMVEKLTTTQVHFRMLSDQEIIDYISTGEPLDKAGAYGIQGLGGRFVEKIEGPFDNVVGLPVAVVQELLAANQWSV